jgi:putative membrane protein
MRIGVIAAALAGLAVALWLVFHVGFASVIGAVASVGWGGFAALCAFALLHLVVLGLAWAVLMPGGRSGAFIWARIVRDAAGEVLPFSQIGGLVIGARAAILRGVSSVTAFASTVVDITTELMAQIVFILIGIALFRTGLPAATVAGVVFVLAGGLVFVVLQRKGFAMAGGLAERFVPAIARQTHAFHAEVEALYAAPVRLAASSAIHLVGWLMSAGATWIAILLIGGHIGFSGAIAIESVLCALRSAAIVVPAALGVQEAGYALLFPLFGLPAEMGLAVSLLKRAREIAIGAPVLIAWQGMEGRRALAAPET